MSVFQHLKRACSSIKSTLTRQKEVPITWSIIVIVLLFFWIQTTLLQSTLFWKLAYGKAFVETLAITPALVAEGFYWQLITYGFLHTSLVHLTINLIVFLSWAPKIERRLGAWGVSCLIWMSVLIGGLFWCAEHGWITHQTTRVCVGISGGVAGLIGYVAFSLIKSRFSLIFLPRKWLIPGWVLTIVLLLSCLIEYLLMSDYLASSVHLGGFVTGWIFAPLLNRLFIERKVPIHE